MKRTVITKARRPVHRPESLIVARALADPARAQILKVIFQGARKTSRGCDPAFGSKAVCVCDIKDSLGMLQSRVSYHLKELKTAGLVEERTRGKWSYYSLRPAALRAYVTSLKREFGL